MCERVGSVDESLPHHRVVPGQLHGAQTSNNDPTTAHTHADRQMRSSDWTQQTAQNSQKRAPRVAVIVVWGQPGERVVGSVNESLPHPTEWCQDSFTILKHRPYDRSYTCRPPDAFSDCNWPANHVNPPDFMGNVWIRLFFLHHTRAS